MPEQLLPPPRLVAWETTRACNLTCRHCRAEACVSSQPGELEHDESRILLAQLAQWSPPPMIILSGGEPLMREDILELATFGTSLGLRMLLSTNGTLITDDLCQKIKTAGIARLSLSLDGPDAASHDTFRGQTGAFNALLESTELLKKSELPFQINSTITPGNIHQTEEIISLSKKLGAVAVHVFLLVPVGRAKNWAETPLSPHEYEEALERLKRQESSMEIEFKATCAPQYNRLGPPQPGRRSGRGCLGGQGFMFVSHDGLACACGYLPLIAGDLRQEHPIEIYNHSPLFKSLRNQTSYNGHCRNCKHWDICGGCRARAHAAGDYLGPEPLCTYNSGPIKELRI